MDLLLAAGIQHLVGFISLRVEFPGGGPVEARVCREVWFSCDADLVGKLSESRFSDTLQERRAGHDSGKKIENDFSSLEIVRPRCFLYHTQSFPNRS